MDTLACDALPSHLLTHRLDVRVTVSPLQSLAGINCGQLGWSAPVAHDEAGNVIMLEPSLAEVKLPADNPKANIPSTEPTVLTALHEGRCVLAFFRSGGVVAGQLGHHWHLVTSMDPQDIADGIVRIGAIAYPQRAAIVSAAALQSQAGCSYEGSASLAAELQRETIGKGKGKGKRGHGEATGGKKEGACQGDLVSPKARGKQKVAVML